MLLRVRMLLHTEFWRWTSKHRDAPRLVDGNYSFRGVSASNYIEGARQCISFHFHLLCQVTTMEHQHACEIDDYAAKPSNPRILHAGIGYFLYIPLSGNVHAECFWSLTVSKPSSGTRPSRRLARPLDGWRRRLANKGIPQSFCSVNAQIHEGMSRSNLR